MKNCIRLKTGSGWYVRLVLGLIVFLGTVFHVESQTLRYVKQNGTGNGSSWNNASGDLQAMINSSAAGNDVWVAAGEYQPASGQSFIMKEGVKIYGGFPATGNPMITDRNYATNVTTLKGNGASVVYNSFNELTNASVLDGFTITGGHAGQGGGIYNKVSSPLLRNLMIKNNSATSEGGGVAALQGSDNFRLENTLITGNTASAQGGGIYVLNSTNPTLVNVTITVNTAGAGSGVFMERSNLNVYNSIVWGNTGGANFKGAINSMDGRTNLAYNLIQGSGGSGTGWNTGVGTDGGNNIDADPVFVDAANGNYALRTWSPAVNKGQASFYGDVASSRDLAFNPRLYGTAVDMGAYENQEVQNAPIRYVLQGGTGNGYTWATASGDLQAMVNASASGNEVWVAAGEYQPASGQSFIMKEGVKIYGGFPATGNPTITDRNYATNVTTLKGNGASVVYNNFNSLTNASVLDGFTITGGHAGQGGGIYNKVSSPLLRNLMIKNNSATSEGGGVAALQGSDNFRLENTLITGNTASAQGGGIYVLNSTNPTLVNVTISVNTAGAGSGVFMERSNLNVYNSIVWGNTGGANFKGAINSMDGRTNLAYNLIQGSGGSGTGWNAGVGTDGGNNIDADPAFVDPASGNFSIYPWSPAINAGHASFFTDVAWSLDLAYRARSYGTGIDIGAYENQQIQEASVRYVRHGATGGGYSWADAAGDLQAIINFSAAGNEVWVAAGEYQPPVGQSFSMKEGVKIYGGFAQTGNPTFNDRNYASHVTTLKGNGAGVIANVNNGLTHAAILDGFTITGGNAGHDNDGGGIRNWYAAPALYNLKIKGNSARTGGGIDNGHANILLVNSEISGNTAHNVGSGVSNYASHSATYVNVTISGNTGSDQSAAVFNEAARPVFVNAIVYGNTDNAGILDHDGANSNVTYSLIQGMPGNAALHNLDGTKSYPNLFVDPSAGNYLLTVGSEANDKGSNTAFPTDLNISRDLSGNPRLAGTTIDLGAYENQVKIQTRYVRQGGTGNGYTWETASGDLQAMINESEFGNEVWVAAGFYQPASGQSFSMKEGVRIYGGFSAEGSPTFSSRDYGTHSTILVGHGNRVFNNDNNGLTAAAVLDGFMVRSGVTTGHGGGMLNRNAFPTVSNCFIALNKAEEGSGGGVYNEGDGTAWFINVLFTGNSAQDGGAVFNTEGSKAVFTNVTLINSVATNRGAAYFDHGTATTTLRNSILWKNKGTGAKVVASTNLTLLHCLLEDGLTSVEGPHTAANIISSNPRFLSPLSIEIDPYSPAIDAGNNDFFTDVSSAKDVASKPRLVGQRIDLGAHEQQNPIEVSIRYVRQNATGSGFTWDDASGDLQAVVNESKSGNEVWVAAGEYQPGTRQFFSMKEGVKIYGGFAATGTPEFIDRNWNQHVTTLKGNDNSVIVNDNNGLTNAALLDGFTITGGSAVTGGGMLNHLAYPLINHCVFKANHATVWGGGIYNDGPGTTTIVNSLIYQNTAQSGAGAFSYQNAKPRFTNVTMTGNTAEQNGGALHNYEGAETELVNAIVWGNNQMAASSQLFTSGEGKTKAYFSVLEGGADAVIGGQEMVDIVSENPLFTDAANGNFTLQDCSPALNIGTAGLLTGFYTDLAGNNRRFGIVDAGAYEYQAAVATAADGLSVDGNVATINIVAMQTYAIRVDGDMCRSVAEITPNGDQPISGGVTVTTSIDNAVQTHNGTPYVQRHYDISPTDHASTATARVTLFFTQEEFSAYNTKMGAEVLPTGVADNTGRSNIRIYQYHGKGTNGNSPGNYQGAPTTHIPDVKWNYALERWELSFDVKGFSGFFVGSADAALPVKLVSFEAKQAENNTVALQWQVTEQVDIAEYTVERGINARDFAPIGTVAANGDAESRYRFTDADLAPVAVVYYRLKMEELDGSYSYSKIISVNLPEQKSDLMVYPVPARDFVRVKGKGVSGTSLMLINVQGIILKTMLATSDDQEIDLSMLPAGIYFIQTDSGHGLKMIKE